MTKLQELLIKKITSINDERILLEVSRILETGLEEDVYQMSDEQIGAVEEAQEQIRNSQFFTDEEVRKQSEAVVSDPEILGGTPVFSGTRVPLKNLFDYLETGESIETFLEDFEGIKKTQVIKVLELSKRLLSSNNNAT
jgi:uncharacterized protein (DUF433 family)